MSLSPFRAPPRWTAGVGVTSGIIVMLLFACSAQAACREIPADPTAATVLDEAASELGWDPMLPCGRTSGRTIGSASVVQVGGDPALVLTVTRRTDLNYVLTQATASAGGSAIPIGTKRVSVESEDVLATGYEGSDGSGGTMLYLRWQIGERVFEYQAALTQRYPRTDAYRDVQDLIEQSLAVGNVD
jgi:hypothetical protein